MKLALDLATVLGFALGDGRGIKVSGSRRLPATGDDVGAFLDAYRAWLTTGLKRHKVHMVGFEQPILRAESKPSILRKLYGLAGMTELVVLDVSRELGMKIECTEINISDWRAHFLGKGYPRKSEKAKKACMAVCDRRGFKYLDHNEAEAIGILDYMISVENPAFALRAMPLFGGKSA